MFAAGDIAAFPVPPNGEIARIEHWRVAEEQGRIAALNMMERRTPYAGIPYFWTTHFDVRFDYVGHAEHWDEIILRGDLDKPDFIAFYINGGRPAAAIAARQEMQAANVYGTAAPESYAGPGRVAMRSVRPDWVSFR